ncbi:hypothetical protein CKJ63_07390 [Mycobacterium avium]|nr:hypothetical protein CKJ63_07390 [Mycobacterium avium]
MPSRQFSATIIGGAWPRTDPSDIQSAAEAQHRKGVRLLNNAEAARSEAAEVAAEQSGEAVDGFCAKCHSYAATFTSQADRYFALERTSEECARLTYGLREDLDQIDAEAHRAIQQIMQWVQSGAMLAALAGVEIMQIIAAARAAAMAKSAEVTAALAAALAKVGIKADPAGSTTSTESSGEGTDPGFTISPGKGGFGGGGPGGLRDGMPTGRLDPSDLPEDLAHGQKPPESGDHWHDIGGGGAEGDSSRGDKSPTGDKTPSGDPASSGLGDKDAAPGAGRHWHDVDGQGPPLASPGSGISGGGGGGGPSVSSLGSAGGLGGGGFPKMPSTPSGLGSGGGGLPTQGLGSPGSLGSGALPGGAGAPSAPLSAPATSSDFSRGLSAGLGGGGGPAAPFAPPVTPPASTASGSAAPAGTVASGPAPVAAAGGGPAVPSTPATPGAAAGPTAGPAGAGVPSAPVGPLPPFGSDVPRTAAPAAVTPAAGPPAPGPSPAGGSSTAGPLAPLPPGVVGSGVGASAGAASEGIRSSLPDPLLSSASQLVYQLLHDSRMYPYMDWCVGIFRTSSGIETLIVNSEGAGYIPAGVFVPRSARMLFADSGLSPQFRARWFSWANPAETMLAYAQLAAEHREDVELWALAVSTDDGGSSMPARSMIEHYEDCSRSLTPIPDDAPTSQLDDTHAHRLETLDRALYSRLTGFGEGPLPDRSEAWRTTVAAAQRALGRAGSIPDLAVAPAIREVLDLLGQGLPVPASRWQELEAAHIGVLMSGAGLRPGRVGSDAAAAVHVLAYHDLSRLIELLLLWRLDSIAYPEIAYLASQIQLSPWISGVGS